MNHLPLLLLLLATVAALLCAGVESRHAGHQSSPAFAHRRQEWKHRPAVQKHIIELVNSNPNATWKAGINERFSRSTLHAASTLCGVSPSWMRSYASRPSVLPSLESLERRGGLKHSCASPALKDLPPSYDVRDVWAATCPVLNDITDQGSCGSCWAVSAASAMSDRNCIFANGTWNSYASSTDILSCCGYQCGSCEGGQPDEAWAYWLKQGVVTGGPYGDTTSCAPYLIRPCEHDAGAGIRPACTGEGGPTPYCTRSCQKSSGKQWYEDQENGFSAYRVGQGQNIAAIQAELVKRGSIQATFYIYEDFLHYKSGIYTHLHGEMLGGHAVKLVGYGTDEAGVDYWTLANSWNTDWGDKGFFKIRRGTNEASIEELLFSGIPQIPAPPAQAAAVSSSPLASELKAALHPIVEAVADSMLDAIIDAAVDGQ